MKSSSNTFISRIIGFSLASWVNCVIAVIATPITTALFSPEEMGKISLFLSYANFIVPFIYFGFDQAYCRYYNEPIGNNTKESLFKLISKIMLALSLIVSAVVACLWRYFSVSILGYPTIIVSVNLIVYALGLMFSRMCALKYRMDNNVKQFCINSILATVIIKLSIVLVVLIKPTAELAISARSILLFSIFLAFFIVAFKQSKGKIDSSKDTIVKLSKFSIPLFPTVFLVTLNLSLSQFILKDYVDFRMMGIFYNGIMIASLISVIQSGLGSFWTPFVYEYYKKDQRLIQKAQGCISLIIVSLALSIVLAQDIIYYVLVDKDYWESKLILALLLLGPVCDSLSETLGLGIQLSGKTILKLPAYVVNVLVNYASCIILIPTMGISGAAIASALASLSMLITKAAIGEYFYRCCNNYLKVIIVMAFLLMAGFMNYLHHSYVYYYSLFALLAVLFVYRQEASLIYLRGLEYVNHKILKK